MNLQETFDKVALHLLRQGKQSMAFNTCSYRGPKGTSCAVGCLIPDELYNDWLECNGIDQIIDEEILSENALDLAVDVPTEAIRERVRKLRELFGIDEHPRMLDMLRKLQHIHDSIQPDIWRSYLLAVADEFGLEWRLHSEVTVTWEIRT